MDGMKQMKRTLLVLALAAQAAACTAVRAHVQPEDHPALVVPPVPPRVIDPLPAEPQPIEPVGELPVAPASPPRSKPPAREQNRPANSDSKTESKPAETPAADPTTTQQPPATPPVPPLRTPGTTDGPEMAKHVRETLDRANQKLSHVDYQALKPDSRANYDNAKSFIKQAEEMLKANNLVAAKLLADRAENIAKQLGG
jgi:hypothetical protein